MPAPGQTMQEWERQQRAWATRPLVRPPVHRGYQPPPHADIELIQREADEARKLMVAV